ncbi:chromate efflux transporter [Pseudomonas multiresinivorans]|uniref:Chromate efflux transporter n=1 Tax=Pseudomonas multiresinivorans TaxID=95301 RepID=A0A7Z3BQM9_9PSED|nr:chromate efflux transporter [Pseudomonas multiresinivorans]QJP11252.1 chromate efflux transporter [Pseudomonas multiresinivorans]
MTEPTPRDSLWTVLLIFLRLGLTSFGGPVAHLGYFREEFVRRRRWLDEHHYADLIALCQFLPGPASSQLGMALGALRAGQWGALVAWVGFTLPSALLMILVALGLSRHGQWLPAGALHGLMLVSVAVVAHAVWGMARSLCPDWQRQGLMILVTAVALRWPGVAVQLLAILGAALIGMAWLQPSVASEAVGPGHSTPRCRGSFYLLLFFALLALLPLAAAVWHLPWLAQFDAFYRVGSLVFGGGHVVLPLLQSAVVEPGWVDAQTFLAGYAAAQALPGPLFTFAAFLGAANAEPGGVAGALLCLLAIFLPSFLLVLGALPFWESLRRQRRLRAALAGVNTAVVGLLLAALIHPIGSETIVGLLDIGLVALAFLVLLSGRLPPWTLVLLGALGGGLASSF